SLARDVAEACGTVGYMSRLERTQSGIFTADTAVSLDDLTEENVSEFLIPTEAVLPFPVLKDADERLFHGVRLPCSEADGDYKVYRGSEFYGLARVADGQVKIQTKLC
ncbi:MAG: hypothetical protein ACI4NG_02135, partial [Candidatus Gallimonas sp.]